MTKQEFLKGWKLLILQSWGRHYRQLGPDDIPTADTLTQLEFYFTQLNWADAEAWMKVATMYARGNAWPSVDDIDKSLRAVNLQFVKAIPDHSTKEFTECPAEVQVMLDRILKRETWSQESEEDAEAKGVV